MDLTLNNPRKLICHQTNKTTFKVDMPLNKGAKPGYTIKKLSYTELLYLPNPSSREGYDTRSLFKRSSTGLNSEYSFSYTSCLTKAEEPSLSYYLSIAWGRIMGFIPFLRVLVLCEKQLAWSRIWTRIVVSNSNDDNHYTTGTSIYIHIQNYRLTTILKEYFAFPEALALQEPYHLIL